MSDNRAVTNPAYALNASPPEATAASDALVLSLVPSAPRTPSPAAREAIFKYQGGQRALLFIGIIFALAGSGAGWVFAGDAFLDLYLAVAGTPAQGTVVSSELARDVRINGRHPTRITFSYRAHDGERLGTSATLDADVAAALLPGAPVALEVAEPGLARLRGLTLSMFGYGGLFVLLFPLLGVGLVAAAVRSNRREKRAFVEGTAAIAEVTFSGADRSTKINGRHPFLVEWQFVADDGQTCRGKLSSMERTHLDAVFGVPRIPVLYLREDPSVNTVYIP